MINRAQLMALGGTHEGARALQVAVRLGVFEALASRPLSSTTIAKRIQASQRGTDLLLNALVGLGLLKKSGDRYSLPAFAKKYLLKASPDSYATMFAFKAYNYEGFANLDKAVRSGRPIRQPDMYQQEWHRLELFIGAMHDIATVRGDAGILAKKLDLKCYRKLLDIGGGPGTYSIAFCRANPQLKASIFDLPETCKISRRMLRKNDTTGRVSVTIGDFNKDPLPSGFDVAFLSNIIHSETERDNRRLIKKCYRALEPGGQIIIKDHLLNDALTHPREGAVFSLTMLLYTRGRSYAAREVKGWMREAGFVKIRRLRMPKPMISGLMIGEKPEC